MEYYFVLKRKEILAHVTIWMNLEDTMLREISQSQKDVLYDYAYETTRIFEFIKTLE